ncbi:Bifunctional dihydroflavonol 4-reductase/flavanone 4-reductase [Glycine soja]|nr:Bifunctional dihydroflavonol 4-reductase/flavanone 4-reductase [Glycine soja]
MSVRRRQSDVQTFKQVRLMFKNYLVEPKVEGRYICSACDATIHDIAKLINEKYPEYKIPTKFKNIPDQLELVRFSSKKITDLGFQFMYNLEDMYTGAIDTCRDKGLLPKPAEKGLLTN